MKRIGTFLIAVALVVGMVGCGEVVDNGNGNGDGNGDGNGNGEVSYQLTVSSTSGGSVIEPGEGVHVYDQGTVVDLVAEADTGHRFVNWTGDVSTVADVDAASTTITMNGNYSITASFEDTPPVQYQLTISSTTGGSVTTPGEGTFTYDAGTVIDLEALAEDHHGFAKWTGDISKVVDASSASTHIVMNGDYSVAACFGIAIHDWYDLHAIRDDLSGSYVLMNDLDSSTAGYTGLASFTANGGKGWEPIGTWGRFDGEEDRWVGDIFSGAFYGRGCEISDMFISRPGEDQVGLFGISGIGGVIEDTGVANSAVTGRHLVGALVGWNAGGRIVRSYHSGGTVDGIDRVGGLLGWNVAGGMVCSSHYDYSNVLVNGQNVITIGALLSEDFEQWMANDRFLSVDERLSQEDGYYLIADPEDFKQLLLFGQNDSLKFRLMQDLDLADDPGFYVPFFSGEFDGNGYRIANPSFSSDFVMPVGLFGLLRGKVRRVIVENVSITGFVLVGGLVGQNGGEISDSFSTGAVYGQACVGGLVGTNWGTVSRSSSAASVAGGQSGGLVGCNHGIVHDSHASGSVTGYGLVGGLVGDNLRGTVTSCYSIGTVTADEQAGGLVGNDWSGTVTNSFWDTDISGMIASDGGTGKTTTQMKSLATFADAEMEGLDEPWDIVAVASGETNPAYTWNIVDGQTYPFLSWQIGS